MANNGGVVPNQNPVVQRAAGAQVGQGQAAAQVALPAHHQNLVARAAAAGGVFVGGMNQRADSSVSDTIVVPANAAAEVIQKAGAVNAIAATMRIGHLGYFLEKIGSMFAPVVTDDLSAQSKAAANAFVSAATSSWGLQYSQKARYLTVDHKKVIAALIQSMTSMGIETPKAVNMLISFAVTAAHFGVKKEALPVANVDPDVSKMWSFVHSVGKLVPGFKISHVLQAYAPASCYAMVFKSPALSMIGLPRILCHPQAAGVCPRRLWSVFGERITTYSFHFSILVSKRKGKHTGEELRALYEKAETFANSIQSGGFVSEAFKEQLFLTMIATEHTHMLQSNMTAAANIQAYIQGFVDDAAAAMKGTLSDKHAVDKRGLSFPALGTVNETVDLDYFLPPNHRITEIVQAVKTWYAPGTVFLNDTHFGQANLDVATFDARYPGVFNFFAHGPFIIDGSATNAAGVANTLDNWLIHILSSYEAAGIGGQRGVMMSVAGNLAAYQVAANGNEPDGLAAWIKSHRRAGEGD